MKKTYYQYFDSNVDKFYYYDVDSQISSFDFPKDGDVFDPNTDEIILPEIIENNNDINQSILEVEINNEILEEEIIIEIPKIIENKPKPPKFVEDGINEANNGIKFQIDNSNDMDYIKFAEINFNQPKSGFLFFKKNIPFEEIISFTLNPIQDSLLNSINSNDKKKAIYSFEIILSYMFNKPLKTKEPPILALMKIIQNYQNLIDEIYFQILKQLYNNSNEEFMFKIWELLLILTTTTPSSLNLQKIILKFIYQFIISNNPRISKYAQLCFIRFESRCESEILLPLNTIEYYRYLITSPIEHRKTFGVSIKETMWSQENIYVNCPFPFIVHAMAKQIIQVNGFNTEGLFRLPGNMKLIKEVSDRITICLDILDSLKVHDIGSLFKMWFRELTVPLISKKFINKFIELGENQGKELEFLSNLPNYNFLTILYLIGFLKDCSNHFETTKMGIYNLAVVFGPNIIELPSDPTMMKKITTISVEFLRRCIETIDTSFIYPLPEQFG